MARLRWDKVNFPAGDNSLAISRRNHFWAKVREQKAIRRFRERQKPFTLYDAAIRRLMSMHGFGWMKAERYYKKMSAEDVDRLLEIAKPYVEERPKRRKRKKKMKKKDWS